MSKMKKIVLVLSILLLLLGCSKNDIDSNQNGNEQENDEIESVDGENDKDEEVNESIVQLEQSKITPAVEVHFKEGNDYKIVYHGNPTGADSQSFNITREGKSVVEVILCDIEYLDPLNEYWTDEYEDTTKIDEGENDKFEYYIFEFAAKEGRPNGKFSSVVYLKNYDFGFILTAERDVYKSSFSDTDEMLNDIEETLDRMSMIVYD